MQRPAFPRSRAALVSHRRRDSRPRGVREADKAAFNSRRLQRTHAKLFYARHCNWLTGGGTGGAGGGGEGEGEGARDCRDSGTEGSLCADARGRVNNVSRL